MLRFLLAFSLLAIAFALSGCGAVTYERARVVGSTVSNPTLGRGISYRLPADYALLNPYAPVPALPESQEFENYLRRVVAYNDKPDISFAFRETLLYRTQDRYLVAFHNAQNIPTTFRSMSPERRAFVLPEIAASNCRVFSVPNREQKDELIEISAHSAVHHRSFLLDAAGPAGRGWMGTGFLLLGDVTDVVAVYVFSRRHDGDAAQADLKVVMDSFRYGAAAKTAP